MDMSLQLTGLTQDCLLVTYSADLYQVLHEKLVLRVETEEGRGRVHPAWWPRAPGFAQVQLQPAAELVSLDQLWKALIIRFFQMHLFAR
jgi:hypothetical protein